MQALSSAPESVLAGVPFDSPMLPSGFGVLYSGQSFTAHVVCLNHTRLPVGDVSMAVSMLTGPGGATVTPLPDVRLLDTPSDGQGDDSGPSSPTNDFVQIAAGGHGDMMVRLSALQGGLHSLRVTVRYRDFHGQQRQLQRNYRFQVKDAFASSLACVPSLSHQSPLSTGTVVTATLRNVTSTAASLGSCAFLPAPGCTARLLQVRIGGESPAAGMGSGSLPQWAGPACEEVDGEEWSTSAAFAKEPLLYPGQEVEVSFLVLRHLVQPRGGALAAALPQGTFELGEYDAHAMRVSTAADAELGRVIVPWTVGVGEEGTWRSKAIASTASSPSLCHVVAPSAVEVGPGEMVEVPVFLTSLSTNEEHSAFTLQLSPPEGCGCAVLGCEVVSSGKLPPCGVVAHAFQLAGLAPGSHRLELVVSRAGADAPDCRADGQAMLEAPLGEGQRLAWHTLYVRVGS